MKGDGIKDSQNKKVWGKEAIPVKVGVQSEKKCEKTRFPIRRPVLKVPSSQGIQTSSAAVHSHESGVKYIFLEHFFLMCGRSEDCE